MEAEHPRGHTEIYRPASRPAVVRDSTVVPGSDTWPTASQGVIVPERVLAFPRADLLPVLVLLIMTGLTAWSHFSLQHRLYDLDTLTFYIPWYSFMG
jgi:hypothetical protein